MSLDTPHLVLAVPSKGRIEAATLALFEGAGLPLRRGRGARDYRGAVDGLPGVEVAFLSASDIAGELARGAAHLGVTGEDLVREGVEDWERRLAVLAPLGFGRADVVVAVPRAWVDARTMADLEDVAAAFHARHGRRLRVATKYLNLARAHFAAHGVGDYRLVESLGATEGAPAAGAAEAVVDITTTGATLEANGLKVLDDGVILRSQACLVASLGASWGPGARAGARAVLARLAAVARAREIREVRARVPGDPAAVAEAAGEAFGARAPFGAEPVLLLHVAAPRAAALADWLVAQGAPVATVAALAEVVEAEDPLTAALLARLEARGAA